MFELDYVLFVGFFFSVFRGFVLSLARTLSRNCIHTKYRVPRVAGSPTPIPTPKAILSDSDNVLEDWEGFVESEV